jgi:hypothetical protein
MKAALISVFAAGRLFSGSRLFASFEPVLSQLLDDVEGVPMMVTGFPGQFPDGPLML